MPSGAVLSGSEMCAVLSARSGQGSLATSDSSSSPSPEELNVRTLPDAGSCVGLTTDARRTSWCAWINAPVDVASASAHPGGRGAVGMSWNSLWSIDRGCLQHLRRENEWTPVRDDQLSPVK